MGTDVQVTDQSFQFPFSDLIWDCEPGLNTEVVCEVCSSKVTLI